MKIPDCGRAVNDITIPPDGYFPKIFVILLFLKIILSFSLKVIYLNNKGLKTFIRLSEKWVLSNIKKFIKKWSSAKINTCTYVQKDTHR